MAKTVLTIEVEYDENMTDADGVASAVGLLLDNALSTPGILDDHGELRLGDVVAGPEAATADASQAASGPYKIFRIPLEISFTTDPAELDDRQGEPVATRESLVAWLQDDRACPPLVGKGTSPPSGATPEVLHRRPRRERGVVGGNHP
jgi:hypothetical protein